MALYRVYSQVTLTSPYTVYDLTIVLPVASASAYTGSEICSGSFVCDPPLEITNSSYLFGEQPYNDLIFFDSIATSGTLTSVPSAVTPEPSGFRLLGTGWLGRG